MLRARGLKVGGRKAELIDRLRGNPPADVPSSKEAASTMEDISPTQFDGAIPLDGIVIEAGKSWGLFQRSAVALEAKIRELEPDVQIYGHPRGKGPKDGVLSTYKKFQVSQKLLPQVHSVCD